MKLSLVRGFLALTVIAVISMCGVPVVFAEPETYDIPDFKPQQVAHVVPINVQTPAMPSFHTLVSDERKDEIAKQDQLKRKKAKKKSMAALFQKYNNKLDDGEALKYVDFIMQACEKFNQDPFVIAAMIVNESSAKHDAVSKGGDYGLMQVRWRVHQKKIRKQYPHIASANDMLDPKYNVLVGTEIFKTYLNTAKQDVRGGLLYYSAGNQKLADKIFAVLEQLEKSYLEHMKNS